MSKTEEILKKYAKIQLWTFIILVISLAILYIVNTNAFCYEVIPPTVDQNYYTPTSECKIVDYNEGQAITKRMNYTLLIISISLIGLIGFNPDFREGIKKKVLKK